MRNTAQGLLLAAVMILTIVAADLLFFRHHTGQRLIVNIGIVIVYLSIYWRLSKSN